MRYWRGVQDHLGGRPEAIFRRKRFCANCKPRSQPVCWAGDMAAAGRGTVDLLQETCTRPRPVFDAAAHPAAP